jgi:hypothetical protein
VCDRLSRVPTTVVVLTTYCSMARPWLIRRELISCSSIMNWSTLPWILVSLTLTLTLTSTLTVILVLTLPSFNSNPNPNLSCNPSLKRNLYYAYEKHYSLFACCEQLLYDACCAGDALFFDCNLLHTSDKNPSENKRWAFLCAYNRADNDPVYKHHHPNYTPLHKVRCHDDLPLPLLQ